MSGSGTFSFLLGLSALLLAVTDCPSANLRVPVTQPVWLPCLALAVLAGASTALALRDPLLVAAAYGF